MRRLSPDLKPHLKPYFKSYLNRRLPRFPGIDQWSILADRLAKLVNDLRQVADAAHPVEVVDNHVQSALQELSDSVATISRLERCDFNRRLLILFLCEFQFPTKEF